MPFFCVSNRFVELFLGYILIPLFKPYDPLCFLRCLFESYRVLCGHSLQKTSREKSLGPVRFLWGPTWSLYGKKILLHSCTNYEKIRFWKKNHFFGISWKNILDFFFWNILLPCCSFVTLEVLCATSLARLSFIWSYGVICGPMGPHPMGTYGCLFLQKWLREEKILFGKKNFIA